jgi:outer membrane protein assembly factor BamB
MKHAAHHVDVQSVCLLEGCFDYMKSPRRFNCEPYLKCSHSRGRNRRKIAMHVVIVSTLGLVGTSGFAGDWSQMQHDAAKTGSTNTERMQSLVPKFDLSLQAGGTDTVFNIATAVTVGDTVFIGTNDGAAVAVASRSGIEKWRVQTAGPVRGAPIYVNGMAIFPSNDGMLRALNSKEGGEEIWRFDAGSPITGPPMFATISNEVRLFFGTSTGKVFCVRAIDGTLVWTASTSGAIWGSPSLNLLYGHVYVPSYDENIYALDATTGNRIWVTDQMGIALGPVRSSVAVMGDSLYVATLKNGLIALRDAGSTVSQKWQIWTGTHTGSAAAVQTGPVTSPVSIFVANDAGWVWAIEDSTGVGSKVWEKNITSGNRIAASLAYSDGQLFVCSEEGKLHVVDAVTGDEKVALSATAALDSSPAIAHGDVIVADASGRLYAFGNPLDPPLNLSAMVVDNHRVILSWSPVYEKPLGVTPVSGYTIYRSLQPESEFAPIGYVEGQRIIRNERGEITVVLTTSVYTDTGISTPGFYYYSVTSINEETGEPPLEESTYSDIVGAAVVISNVPPHVADLSARAGDGVIQLDWALESGDYRVSHLWLFRREGTGSSLVFSRTIAANETSFDDLYVENGVEYGYALVAVDVAGNIGPQTAEVGATPYTIDWPMFRRNVLHEGSDPSVLMPPPLGERWRASLAPIVPPGFWRSQEPIVVGGTVFAASYGGGVVALKASTGGTVWQLSGFTGALSSPAYHNGMVYVTCGGGLKALNAASGNTEWELPAGVVGIGLESSPIVYKNVLFAGMKVDGVLKLVAVDIETRQVKWISDVNLVMDIRPSPAAASGTIFIVDQGGNVRAFDANNGVQAWIRPLGKNVWATEGLSLSVEPPVLQVVAFDGLLYSIRTTDGEILWSRDVGGRFGAPALYGGTVFTSSSVDSGLYARSISTGDIGWVAHTWTVTGTYINSGPTVTDGRVHVYATNGQLFTFDVTSGVKLGADKIRLTRAILVNYNQLTASRDQMYVTEGNAQIIAITPVNPAPTGLTAIEQSGVISLSWSAPPPNIYGITGYRIYRSRALGVEGTPIADVNGTNTTSFVDHDAEPGWEYYYIVRAIDSRDVAGQPSDAVMVPTYLPFALADIKAQGHDGYIQLSWSTDTSPYEADFVDIFRKEGDGSLTYLIEYPLSMAGYVDMQVENRVRYAYELRPVENQGRLCRLSSEISATPLTVDWPMIQRDMLHEGSNPEVSVSPPLGERWRVSMTTLLDGQGFSKNQGAIVVGATVFVVSAGGDVRALRAKTGVALWQKSGYSYSVSSPAYYRGNIYFTHGNGLTMLDATNGLTLWSLPASVVGEGQESSPIIYKGVLYAGMNYNGSLKLVAVDLATHQVKWMSAGRLTAFINASPAAAQNKVYTIDGGGTIRAFNWANGTLMRSWDIGSNASTTEGLSLSVIPPVLMVVHGDGSLYAFGATNGEYLWSANVQGKCTAAISGATVYVASDGVNTIYAHNIVTGSQVWTGYTWTDTGSWAHGGPLVADGRVHVYTTNGQLFTLDKETGGALDVMQVENATLFTGHMSAGAGQLYVPTYGGQIVAVTPVNPAPTGLTAVEKDREVTLNWSAPVPNVYGISGYRVFRSEIQGQEGTAIADVNGIMNTTYLDAGLQLGAEYFYTVKALDSRGVLGRPSNSVDISIQMTITGVTVVGYDGYTRLSWAVPESEHFITQVNVYRRENDGAFAWFKQVPFTSGGIDDLSVENRLLYSYELQPVDSTGQLGLLSASVSATPLTVDWPMFQRDTLHEAYDPGLSVSPPLAERWRVRLSARRDGQGFSGYQGGIIVGGTLFVTSVGGDVRAYVAKTGTLIWSRNGCAEAISSPAYYKGRLYVTHGGGLTVFLADSGNIEWSAPIDKVGYGQESSPVIYKGILYAGMIYQNQFQLVAIDINPSSYSYQSVIWARPFGYTFVKASPGASRGLIYMVDGGGNVKGMDYLTGAVVWTEWLGSYVTTTESINISVYPPVVLIAHSNGNVYAFDSTNGDPKWHKYVGSCFTSPAVAGVTVFIASHRQNTVYALNSSNGETFWVATTYTESGEIYQGGPIVAAGRLHVYSTNGQLFTIDASNGSVLDSLKLENAPLFAAHLSGGEGQLYVPTFDGQLIAVTPVPRVPADLAAVRVVGGIRLSWTPSIPNEFPVVGYRIYRADTRDGPETILPEVPGGESDGYTDPVLPGGVYYYRVTAVDARGLEGRKSDQVSASAFYPPNITTLMQVQDLADGQFACPGHVYEVTGTAQSGNFSRYTLGLDRGSGFERLKESLVPVENGLLGTVTITGSGSPVLLLTVYDLTGETGSVSVYLESPAKNITAVVSWPDAGQIVPTDCSSFTAEVRGSAYADNFTRYRLKVVQTAPQIRVILDEEYLNEKRDADSLLETVTFPECGSYVVDLVVEDKCSNTTTVESAIDLTSAEFLVSSVITFSARGRDPGEHRRPWDVAVDNEDYVWVVDTQNKRVQKYTAEGRLLLEAGEQQTGKKEGLSFLAPVAAAVDSSNRLLVLDRLTGKIIRLDANGNTLDVLGGSGKGPGEFLGSEGMTVDSNGRIYIAETLSNRIQVVDAEGKSLLVFGALGSGQGQFDHPGGVGVDPHTGNIIVVDTGNNRVQTFNSSGEYLVGFGAQGAGAGDFDRPHDVVAGLGHNMFVSETNNNRASWFTLFGLENRWVTALPPLGYTLPFLNQPHGVAMDRQESMLYIADTGNNRVVGVPIKRGVPDTVMPRAVILSPAAAGTVTGFVDVRGIAADAHFAGYKLEYGNGTNPAIWSLIAVSSTPVWDGALGAWDTRNLVPGSYSLRLTVTDKSNNTSSAIVEVQVNNQPSALIVSASAQPSVFIPDQSGVVFTYCLSAPAAVRALIVGNDSNHPLWTSETIVPGGYGGMAGSNIMAWDGRDEHGQWVLPGRYTMLIIASAGAITDKKSVPIIADLTLAERSRGLGGTVSGGASGSVASAANSGGSDVSGSGGSRSNPDGSGSGASGSSSTGSGTHDNGMGNGKNPKDFDRGSNPGQHGGNGKK